ncbi:MAG: phosphoribosylformylglycinamidine synthase subunit PurL [Spirochaetae bacterium HGW-Spirochaetae-3]|jgi:phosphoribosylformylglycinamidine synthase|nr:MAG: phosphoribosylformylglycinamidine synthase subunit PurL [Spirochaetae bacterium HGW-Spirochaetae-3]
METSTDVYRFLVRPKERPGEHCGPRARSLAADARALGLSKIRAVHRAAIYFVRGTIAPKELSLLGRFLFCDPVVEDCAWERVGDAAPAGAPARARRIEVSLRPGVTDPVADEAARAARELGIKGVEAVSTGDAFDVEGDGVTDGDLRLLAERLLCNAVIQRWAIGRIEPSWPDEAAGSGEVERMDVGSMDDAALLALSAERRAALDVAEMVVIRDYFNREGRACTDAEFETIAQTWSEHCVHKTFKALIEVDAPGYPPFVDNVLKSYIKKASDEIAAPWVLSAFVDNAGIIEFDDEYEVSFKVETHNHPSAVEPFGGANTGVGGVIRDVMGVSARPIAATDVLCFGPPDAAPEEVPAGSLHPRRIASGVIAGVQDYGNKMGVPTVNGGIHYDHGYSANPLVYCGCAGIAPRGRHPKAAAAGDRVVVLGGRTGRDGLRGATFSSMVMDSSTGELSGASVQIGAPIVQKKVSEALIAARDAGLYSAITDCGAGGLSSAVGEMASVLGADVDIARAPLKYPGLAPWEIWLSEAQERMVVAVPPKDMDALRAICDAVDVEMTDLGRFTGEGRLVVRYGGATVIDIDCGFLHSGPPQRRLRAAPPVDASAGEPADERAPAGAAVSPAPAVGEALLAILAHPAVVSREPTVRLYDHEVQGATVLRPYDGPAADGPQDAAVLKPRETKGSRGLALSNGFNHRYGAADPYRMAVSAVDEAVRNAVAVGADPERIAVLDNFCLGDPTRRETMWTLLESARGCYDAAIAHGTPFVSGKDSFNNAYLASDGRRVSIPPSLLISAIGIVPDVGNAPGTDLKAEGDPLYLVGNPAPSFGGSVYAELFGLPPGSDPGVPGSPAGAPAAYRALHRAIAAGFVRACHDLSDGGLAAALAEMCIGGRLGARVALDGIGGTAPALFGETNGCLVVEADAPTAAEFERSMAGSPYRRIGETDGEARLLLSVGGEAAVVGLDDMIAAYSGTRSER